MDSRPAATSIAGGAGLRLPGSHRRRRRARDRGYHPRRWGRRLRRPQPRARKAALTDEEYTSPLAGRPYDLRHACVSTWLNGGVPPTQVAEWAGHSVDVLLRIYAKCLAGQEEIAKKRVLAALRT